MSRQPCNLSGSARVLEEGDWNDDFVFSLQKAIDARRATPRKCAALLMTWDKTDLGEEADKDLEDAKTQFGVCLGGRFDFDVNHYHLSTELKDRDDKVARAVYEDVYKWTMKYADCNFFLLYYAGHRGGEKGSFYMSNIVDQTSPDYIRFNWSTIERDLTKKVVAPGADILVVLDSCDAGAAARAPHRGSKELLAACRYDQTVNSCEFTVKLTAALSVWPSKPVSTAELHYVLANNMEQQPIYVVQGANRIPISLTPRDLSYDEDDSDDLEVLIAVRVKDAQRWGRVNDWGAWLSSCVPADVKGIKVEGAFRSQSAIVLVRVPQHIWQMMPSHEAFMTLGKVTPDKMILPGEVLDMESNGKKEPANGTEQPVSQEMDREAKKGFRRVGIPYRFTSVRHVDKIHKKPAAEGDAEGRQNGAKGTGLSNGGKRVK